MGGDDYGGRGGRPTGQMGPGDDFIFLVIVLAIISGPVALVAGIIALVAHFLP